MTENLHFDQIDSRRGALRLPVKDLLAAAGLSQGIWDRLREGGDSVRLGNIRKLAACLLTEEHRLLEHLIALHPEQAARLLAGGRAQGETGSAFAEASADKGEGAPAIRQGETEDAA